MPLFINNSREKVRRKTASAKSEHKVKHDITKPMRYVHEPRHAATDAIIGAPPCWSRDDNSKTLAAHPDRISRDSSQISTASIPRVHSSLSCVSYPSREVNPVISISKSYHYHSLPESLAGTPPASFCESVRRVAPSIDREGRDLAFPLIQRSESIDSIISSNPREHEPTPASRELHSSKSFRSKQNHSNTSPSASNSSAAATDSALEMRCPRSSAEERSIARDTVHNPQQSTSRKPTTRSSPNDAPGPKTSKVAMAANVGSRYAPETEPIAADLAHEALAPKSLQIPAASISSRSLRVKAAQTRVRVSSASSVPSIDSSKSMLWTKILQLPLEAEPIIRDFAYNPPRTVSQVTTTDAASSQWSHGRRSSPRRTHTSRSLNRSNALRSNVPPATSHYGAARLTRAKPLKETISESDESSINSVEERHCCSIETQSTAPTSKTNSSESLRKQGYELPTSTNIAHALSASHPEAIGFPVTSHIDEDADLFDEQSVSSVSSIGETPKRPTRPTRFQETLSLRDTSIDLEYMQTPKGAVNSEEVDFDRLMLAHDLAVRDLKPKGWKKSLRSWFRKSTAWNN